MWVRAVGLNFRDVLNVLGMYPGDPGAPGNDCAGVIAAVGPGVQGLAPGECVRQQLVCLLACVSLMLRMCCI